MLSLIPIGVIRTPYDDRYRAPRQPGEARQGAEGTVILEPGRNFEQALEDLDGFERIWLVYWFDRNETWKPKVLPPRGPRVKRGVFATRSPHRPNPIGLSLVRLLEVSGRTLRVADVDLLDRTPILDIKPYLPYAEAFPDSRMGWLDDVVAGELEGPHYRVTWSPLAERQTAWLAERHGIDLRGHAETILGRDPRPHPYRRIEPHPEGGYRIAIKSWRLRFDVAAQEVTVERIESGYPAEAILRAASGAFEEGPLHDQRAHVEFHGAWNGDLW
jgi:tRNA-Thr(GGU) m(6)t(6)A37 methyltransferase TsaA